MGTKNMFKKLQSAYLYGEGGNLVCFYEEKHPRTANLKLRYVDVYEKYAETEFVGRLAFHAHNTGLLESIRGAKVKVTEPSLDLGNDKTKGMGILVGKAEFTLKSGNHLVVNFMESLLPSEIDFQPTIKYPTLEEGQELENGFTVDRIFHKDTGDAPVMETPKTVVSENTVKEKIQEIAEEKKKDGRATAKSTNPNFHNTEKARAALAAKRALVKEQVKEVLQQTG